MTPETIQRFAGSLLHFIWQGAAIALIASIGLRMLHRRSAELRYAVSVAALVAMLAAPVLTFVFYVETGAFALKLLQFTGKTLVDAAPAASLPQAAATAAWTQWILATWSIGVFAFTARLVAGWRLSHRLVQESDTVVPASILYVFEQLKDRLEVSRPIQLLINAQIDTPMVVGCLRPAVLVPLSALTGLTPEQLTAILAHELAHIRRHDFFVNILQRCVESLLFYHPGVWWLSARIRTEREHCCDDIAVRLCGDRRTYVQALVELERKRQTAPALSVAATGGNLVQRAQRILGLQTSHADWQSAAATLAIVLVWLVVGAWQSSSTLQAKPVLPSTPAPVAAAVLTPMASPAPVAESLSAIAAIMTAQPVVEPQAAAPGISPTASGEVRDARTNEPLSKVRVALFNQPVRPWNPPGIQPVAPAAFASSDSEGRFTISAPPGRYRIVPQLEGYAHFEPSQQDEGFLAPDLWVRIPESGSVENIALRMAPGGVVTGEVLDTDGRPPTRRTAVGLARPAFNERGERRLTGVSGGQAYLDDRGRYRIFGLQPGDYYLVAGGGFPTLRELRTFYPGTSDERRAVPVKVVMGEETRLDAFRLQEETALGEVHLAINDPIWQRGRFSNRIDFAGGYSQGGPDLSVTPYIMREVKPGPLTMILNHVLGDQLFYSLVAVDVQPHGKVEREVTFSRGIQIESTIRMEGSEILAADFPCRLSLTSPAGFEFWTTPCTGAGNTVAGVYRIELHPSVNWEMYIVSAQAAGKDILAGGLQLEADAKVEIVMSRSGGSVVGKVRNTEGNVVASAVVALVPDEPFRAAGVLYRSAVSDRDGEFELRGIRPGNYRMFAWPHFEGAAYRNAEFLKPFEDEGRPVSIERDSKAAVDLRLLGEKRK